MASSTHIVPYEMLIRYGFQNPAQFGQIIGAQVQHTKVYLEDGVYDDDKRETPVAIHLAGDFPMPEFLSDTHIAALAQITELQEQVQVVEQLQFALADATERLQAAYALIAELRGGGGA